MLRSKHLVGLILAATLMATLIPFSATVYAQSSEEKRAEKFIDMAKQAMQKVEELKAIVEGNEIIIPEDITEFYEDGKTKLAEAELEADYDSAIELAKEAMNIFREVYGQLNALLEEAEVETGEEPEDPETLMEAIKRAEERIKRVSDIIEANIDYLTDYAKDELDDLLKKAKEEHLDAAVTALDQDPPDVSTAAKHLGDAHKLISQAFVILKKASGAINSKRIPGFLTVIKKFWDRIDRLVERAKDQGLITYGKYGEFRAELDAISELIEEAEGVSTEVAIGKLIEARIRLESIQKEILEIRRHKPE